MILIIIGLAVFFLSMIALYLWGYDKVKKVMRDLFDGE